MAVAVWKISKRSLAFDPFALQSCGPYPPQSFLKFSTNFHLVPIAEYPILVTPPKRSMKIVVPGGSQVGIALRICVFWVGRQKAMESRGHLSSPHNEQLKGLADGETLRGEGKGILLRRMAPIRLKWVVSSQSPWVVYLCRKLTGRGLGLKGGM